MKSVVVVGAGISGLAAAHELDRAGVSVRVFEANGRAGGFVGTVRRGAYRFELGPHTIQSPAPAFRALCDEVGLGGEIVPAAVRTRYLYDEGRLHPVPTSPWEFLRSRLFTKRERVRAMLEPFIRHSPPDREETVAEFFGRRFGRSITRKWIDVLVSGLYAGSPNRLGIRSAYPELTALERQHKSIMKAFRARAREEGTALPTHLSLRPGLGRLAEVLTERLGDRLAIGTRVEKLVRRPGGGLELTVTGKDGRNESLCCDGIVLAVPAPTTGILLAPFAGEVADLLFEIEYGSLLVAHFGFDAASVPGLREGFGFLIARSMRLRTLGWVQGSHAFPGIAPEGKVGLSGFLGGILDPHAVDLDDEAVRHLLIGELALCLNQRKNPMPEEFGVVRWKDAIPQYNVGHTLRVNAVRALLRMRVPEIALAGNWVGGITVESCIARGRAAARDLIAPSAGDA